LLAGFHKGDTPGIDPGVVVCDRAIADVDIDHISGMQQVIGKEFLDQIALVAEADDELVTPKAA